MWSLSPIASSTTWNYYLELLDVSPNAHHPTSDLWLYLLRFVLLLVLVVLLVRLLVLLCPSSTPVKLQSSRAWSHSRFRSIRAEHPFIGVEMLKACRLGDTCQTNLMEILDVSPNSSHGTTGRFVKFLYYPLAITFILVFLNT